MPFGQTTRVPHGSPKLKQIGPQLVQLELMLIVSRQLEAASLERSIQLLQELYSVIQ